MRRRPGIKDVAALAQVSIKTVSRVVNGEGSVLPATRDRVERSVIELGYVPNGSARILKSGVGDAVGVVVDTIADPFFASLVSVIEDRALRAGMGVLFASTGFDAGRERDQLLRLAGQQVRGIILVPVAENHDYLERYRASTPVVMVDRHMEGYDSVVVDDVDATKAAVADLIRIGHRRIAFVGYDAALSTIRSRHGAYQETLVEHGIALDPRLAPPSPAEVIDTRLATLGLFDLQEPPTAIFAANLRAGIGVADALHGSGRTHVALISFGDFSLAHLLKPAVSCIDHDPYRIGNVAIERLLHLIDTPGTAPQRTVVPTQRLERGSGEIPGPALEMAESA